MIKPTIKNLTTVTVDLCKASTNVQKLLPEHSINVLTTRRAFCHGHSSIGSFIIIRYGEKIFEHKCWGNISLNFNQTPNSYVIEIIQNN